MKTSWLTGVPCILACFISGCDLSSIVELDNSDVSLASLNRASEEHDNKDRLNLPIQSDEYAWNLQPCDQAPQFRNVNLTHAIGKPVGILGIAISNESGKAIVTYRDDRRTKGDRETGGAYCDLRNGQVLSTFNLPDYASPYSIDRTGRHAILSYANGSRSGKETLYIANLDDDTTLKQWRPLCDPDVEEPKLYVKEQEVIWASFVGTDRIVTTNNANTLHVWQFPSLERIASFRGIDGWPALTPDRTQVVFSSGDMLALLDPAEPRIIASHRIGPTLKDPVVAVHPGGDLVALGGDGEAMVINLADDSSFRINANHLNAKPGNDLLPDFGFIGSFLHDTRHLYDFNAPRSVWKLSSGQAGLLQGDAYWTVVYNRKRDWMHTKVPKEIRNQLVLRSYRIPHREIRNRITKVYTETNVLALRSGDLVKLDVSGIPTSHRNETKRKLETALLEKGYIPADSSEITVKAYVDPEKEFDAVYSKSILSFAFSDKLPKDAVRLKYRGQHAHLEIVKGKRVLWSRRGMEKPPRHLKDDEIPSDGQMSFFASPQYTIFSDPGLPEYLAGDYPGVLGETSFYVNEVRSRTNRPRR